MTARRARRWPPDGFVLAAGCRGIGTPGLDYRAANLRSDTPWMNIVASTAPRGRKTDTDTTH